MKVLDPKELEARRNKRVKKHKGHLRKRKLLPFLLPFLLVYVIAALLIPPPLLELRMDDIQLPDTTPVSIQWPAYGQAAVGAVGFGLLQQHGEEKPLPMASIAKVVTAVAVLKVKPIENGDKSAIITLTSQDVALYNQFLGENQSVVPVEAGEQITQYQALQALLLPSANNMADILVRWVFGSTEDYLAFVNPFVKTLGMSKTTIADASGFSPQTMSTAADLATLAEIAMNHPVIAEIVGQPQADIPVAGTVYNYNSLLGQSGVVGIKTGNTDEAGGCYMFAAKRLIDGKYSVTVVGAIMGAPNRGSAINDALPLLDETFKNFKVVTPLQTQQKIGVIAQTGGATVPLVVRQGVTALQWVDQKPRVEVVESAMTTSITDNSDAGKLKLHIGNMVHEASLAAGGTIRSQSPWWRIRHAGGYL